jgi:hypothetical protein
MRNSKNIFLTEKRMIGFQMEINLIYLMRDDNIVFSSLSYENDLFIN